MFTSQPTSKLNIFLLFKKNWQSLSLVSNTALLFIDRIAQIIATLVTSAVIARSAPVSLFGEWQLGLTALFLLATLANVASYEVTIPLLKKFRQNKQLLFNAIMQFRFFIVTICFLMTGLIALCFYSENHFLKILLLLLPMLFREPCMAVVMLLITENKLKKYYFISLSSLLIKIQLTLFFYFTFHFSFYWYFIPLYLENLIFVYFMVRVWKSYHLSLSFQIPQRIKTIILNRSFWGWIFTLATIAYLRVDRIIMAALASQENFALYSAASQINDNWYYFGSILVNTIAPAYIYHQDRKLCAQKAIKTAVYVFLLLSILALVISLKADLIIEILYGLKFKEAASYLSITVWSAMLLPIEMLLASPLIYRGQLKIQSMKAIGSFCMVSLLLVFLFPYFNLYSGAIAFGITFLVELGITLYLIL